MTGVKDNDSHTHSITLKARNIAAMYGLKTTGVVGVLLRGKREGHIASVREYLDRLQREAGFRLSETLYRQILRTG